jgi:hypothetical protein
VVLTSVLGLTSMLYDFKDASGRITRAGGNLLAGLIGSSVISISSTGLEQYKQDQEEAAALKRAMITIENSNRLLKEVNRGLHPLESASSSVVAVLLDQNGGTEVRRYKQQLRAFVAAHPKARNADKSLPGVYINRDARQPRIDVMQEARSLYPGAAAYPALHAALGEVVLTLWLQRAGNAKKMAFEMRPPSFLYAASAHDLRIDLETAAGPPWLTYDLQTDQLRINYEFAAVARQGWDSNGQLASTLDMPGSECLLFLNMYAYPRPTVTYAPRVIRLAFSGQDFWIEEPDAAKEDDQGFRVIRTTMKQAGLSAGK